MKKTWLTKHIGRFSATGRQMKRWHEWHVSRCPRCQHPNKDSNHVTECQAPKAIEKFHDEILKFERELDRNKTTPIILDILTTTLYGDTTATFYSQIRPYDESTPFSAYKLILEAATKQDSIGKTRLLHGHLVTKWQLAQDIIYKSTPGCRQNGNTWAKRTIKGLYRITKSTWDHRNASLFPGSSNISTRRKQKIWRNVKIELKIKDKCIHTKDRDSICFKKKIIKKWSPESQEIWLAHIQRTRDRSISKGTNVEDANLNTKQDEIYQERSSYMRKSASPRFHDWQMKHHQCTLSQHLHSTEELHCQLKRRKLANRWVSSQPFVPGHYDGTGK